MLTVAVVSKMVVESCAVFVHRWGCAEYVSLELSVSGFVSVGSVKSRGLPYVYELVMFVLLMQIRSLLCGDVSGACRGLQPWRRLLGLWFLP